MSEELDRDIDEKSDRKKHLTWAIIAIVIVAIIAVPLVLMRQSEPTEATEPATIEQLEAEIDALYVTVYGTTEVEGLETKIAAQAELIANIETGDCICPDWTGQFSSINSDIATLRTDVDAIVVTDFSANITQIDTDLAGLLADLTMVKTALTALQAQVGIMGTSTLEFDVATLQSDVADLEVALAGIDESIVDLEVAISLLPTTLPPYAEVISIDGGFVDVVVHGTGNYVIIVSLYGHDFWTATVSMNPWIDYCYVGNMYPTSSTLAIGVLPDASWNDGDIIKLMVKNFGGIDYATASVGG